MDLENELFSHFMIKDPCIWIDTFEENSAINSIYAAIKKVALEKNEATGVNVNYSIYEWSEALGGFKMDPNTRKPRANSEVKSTLALDFSYDDNDMLQDTIAPSANALFDAINIAQNIVCENGNEDITLFIIKELPELTNNDKLKRYIRDLKETPPAKKHGQYAPIIIISSNCNIPYNLQKLFVTIKNPIPSVQYIEDVLIPGFLSMNDIEMTEEEKSTIAQAAAGLSTVEISRAFKMSNHLYGKLDHKSISKEKIDTIQKSGILTYKIPKITLDDIGGHEALKDWIKVAKQTMTKKALEFGIKPAKGFLSTGIPGTGKTAIAEAIANYFNVPFVKLDLSKIMGGIVGESERNARMAFEVLDSIGRTVVLIDEVEKALGGK